MRRTLALVSFAVTALVALAFLIPLSITVKEIAKDRAISGAERQAAALIPALAITTDRPALVKAIASTQAGAAGRLAVHLPEGPPLGRPHAAPDLVAESVRLTRALAAPTADGYALLRPVALDGGRVAVVEVYLPEGDLSRGVRHAWAVLAGVAVVLVLASVFAADRLASRVVGASRRLAAAAGALGAGDLRVRIEPEGPPELVAAGRSFNAMADRVVQLLDAERELAADLSHRLRTPLTALRLELGQLGPAAERSRLAVDRLEHEVDEIIAQTRRPSRDQGTSCDAAAVLRDRLEFWAALAEDQGRPWELIGADGGPLEVPVSAADLTAVVDALLGNVFRHTPEGVAFTVTLHRGQEVAGILVADAGPGIPDPDAALRRGGSGAGGTGLGLDIARRLAESADGSLRVDRSSLGGARVQLWLRLGPRAGGPAKRAGRRLLPRRRRAAGVS
ncbi:sensor histidine kinase [Bailinhaonella thermotolerans]|uniref:Signal transduction histidine-protein kinase/phosphatase MprB n=1 Tax=Bailinhaonella thermotolerans TaxID=1070861 RepID=A0A3A4B0X6_9ACTN|nr:HAMP domain-containing sensor histidine kinase [Bailinhaonella thermotolerans]RJL31733.1 sensor histidine kinase [Bailinhaonella thermotolerans]